MDNEWIEKLAIQELSARYCQTIVPQDSAVAGSRMTTW